METSSRRKAYGDGLEARLARIEAKLDKLSDSNPFAAVDQQPSSEPELVENPTASSAEVASGSHALIYRGDYSMPPLTEILPVVEGYFRDFNPALPLFHQAHFMEMLYEFYSAHEQTKKSRAIWAAVNVVLAIGYRMRTIEIEDAVVGFDDRKVKKCIDNAQKELDELVTREEDTLGIQVLLGLVSKGNLAAEDSPELIISKDISLRSKIPSVQDDSDVDLELPGTELGDDGNYLSSIDGRTQLNYLRVRVQLAYLEGKVYDDLLSNRSMKVSSETRQGRVAHLFRLLDQWLQKIPGPLRLENITKTVNKAPLTHMILLYHTYLMCYTTLNGLYSLASPWIRSINGFTAAVLEHFDFHTQVSVGVFKY
ncbi:hypothetical protein ABKA04_004244 [Annulohypoxylon sp. FPYF3050]